LATPTDQPLGERVQKVLARAGLGSRRACEEYIADGRVTIDGAVAQLGDRVDAETQHLAFDGVALPTRTGLVYYLLNKPSGVVSTARDPQGRATVLDLVPSSPRVFPVGRLDFDSEGLLLLTNDGDLTMLLTHPRHGIEKTYLVEVEGVPTAGDLRRLRDGVPLEDGPTAPAGVRLVQRGSGTSAIEITIHEGRNRQVRRMCDAVGHPVRRLVRTRIGPLRDTRLAPGAWRELGVREVRKLYEAATTDDVSGPGSRPAPQ
jgi:23S rRNA pseudouridine2605 synthase